MTFRGFTQVLAPQEFGPPTGQITIGASESQGTAGVAAEADHIHAMPAAAAGDGATTSLPGDTEADGTATTAARSDHRHGREPAAAVTAATAPVFGTVYQNTAGAPLHLTVALTLTPGSTGPLTVSAGIGAANPPATVIAAELAASAAAATIPVSLVVPAGDYYLLDVSLGGGSASAAIVSAVTL